MSSIVRWLGCGWVALLMGLVAAAPAFAQQPRGDSGDYLILEARYGTEERNVDVTDRLRELARLDRTFRMGNDALGVDPDPGRRKVLRIYTRTRDGQVRTFEFVENSVVDGAQFSGWSGGQWGRGSRGGGWHEGFARGGDGGDYRITQAMYGTDRRHVDVTQRLRELAAQDRNFVASNETLGADPDPGRGKTLRIFTLARDGQQRTFDYREGSTVDGTQFTAWRSGSWGQGGPALHWDGTANTTLAIVNASYGSGSRRVDVTERLRSQVRTDKLDVTITNDWAGSDPAPTARKTLWLVYTLGGRTLYAEIGEGARLALP